MISSNRIMSVKNGSQKPENDKVPVVESSPKEVVAVSKHSLISFQDEIDAILNDFGITE